MWGVKLRGKGGEATAVTADVSSEAECIALVEAARQAYGPIDILVNNAALNYYLPTDTYPTNRWLRCFAINVHAPFILLKAVLTTSPPPLGRHRQHQFGRRDRPPPRPISTTILFAAGADVWNYPASLERVPQGRLVSGG